MQNSLHGINWNSLTTATIPRMEIRKSDTVAFSPRESFSFLHVQNLPRYPGRQSDVHVRSEPTQGLCKFRTFTTPTTLRPPTPDDMPSDNCRILNVEARSHANFSLTRPVASGRKVPEARFCAAAPEVPPCISGQMCRLRCFCAGRTCIPPPL